MLRVDIIKDSFDMIAGFEFLNNIEQKEVFQSIINTLANYPKPQKKGSSKKATNKDIAAYLYVSNTRNSSKLAIMGFLDHKEALNTLNINLQNSLTVLLS